MQLQAGLLPLLCEDLALSLYYIDCFILGGGGGGGAKVSDFRVDTTTYWRTCTCSTLQSANV